MFVKTQLLVVLIFGLSAISRIGTAADPDWWKHAIFYQIYPRSFKDSNGDGIGDINGIISKLNHIKNAGATAIWLSPIYESPQVDQGYDISNFTSINPDYGTMDDFKLLVSTAHNLSIKVVMDFVPNHSSNKHEWFKKSEAGDPDFNEYYIWKSGIGDLPNQKPPNNWISAFKNSAWQYSTQRSQYYLHQFAPEQPDLNYRSVKVANAMKDVLKFWLDLNVDGFRMDAVPVLFEDEELRDEPRSNIPGAKEYETNYLRHVYTQNLPETFDTIYEWRKLLDSYSADGSDPRVMMTEVYADIENTMYYYGNEGTDGAHFTFNFFFITDLNKNSNARDLVFTIEKWLKNLPKKYIANWVLGNHDNHRVATRFGPDNVDGYNMLIALLPGIMVTYNGEEIGQEDGEVTFLEGKDPNACSAPEDQFNLLSRDFERTPFHWDNTTNAGFSNASKTWLPVSAKYKLTNLAAQQDPKVQSHFQIYKQLSKLRQQNTLKSGNLQIRAVTDNVVVFSRAIQGSNTYVVILNLSAKNASISIDKQTFSATPYLEVVIPNGKSSRKIGELISTTKVDLKAYESLVAVSTTKVPNTTVPPLPTNPPPTNPPPTNPPPTNPPPTNPPPTNPSPGGSSSPSPQGSSSPTPSTIHVSILLLASFCSIVFNRV